MRIGYVQMEPVLGDPEANRARIAEALRAAPDAELLVLPELASSGYNFESRDAAWAAAEPADGPLVELLTTIARERGTTYVSGFAERAGQELMNSAVVVSPEGRVGLYRKAHLFSTERDLFAPGDLGFPVFEVGGVRLGVLICFDWRFPEAWRCLAIRGADVVAHPSNLVIPGHAQRAVPVHALINRYFVVTANRIGRERGLGFTGRSILADPRGEVLAEAPPDVPEVRVVEVDLSLARDKAVTPRNDILTDRRPGLYHALIEKPA